MMHRPHFRWSLVRHARPRSSLLRRRLPLCHTRPRRPPPRHARSRCPLCATRCPGGPLVPRRATHGPGGPVIARCAMRGTGASRALPIARARLPASSDALPVVARCAMRGPSASRALCTACAHLPVPSGTLPSSGTATSGVSGAGPVFDTTCGAATTSAASPPLSHLSCRAGGVPPICSPTGSSSPPSHSDTAGGWCSLARGPLCYRQGAGDLSSALFRPRRPGGPSLAPCDGR